MNSSGPRRRDVAQATASDPHAGEQAQPIPVAVDADERTRRIALAAYFRAEQRGFAPGCELEDWLEAARQVDRELVPRTGVS
jgi:hypothetical protein